MGATNFACVATGDSAKHAFNTAREEAAYESGHGGYTGIIAEKESYVMCGSFPTLAEAEKEADRLVDIDDKRIVDKWGPAGCIRIAGTNQYLFFGWASC